MHSSSILSIIEGLSMIALSLPLYPTYPSELSPNANTSPVLLMTAEC
jgi:hypothetical protein